MSNAERVNEFLTKSQTFYLATADKDQPKCRPMGLHLLLDGVEYFGVGGFKEVFKQMQANPLVEICATVEHDFLRYYGKAVFETDDRVAELALDGMPYLRSIYNEQTGKKLKIFHLEGGTAEFHAMSGAIEKFSL
jgi:uncharacterized pyridoxamine 5'-phosphate oxidase family protein